MKTATEGFQQRYNAQMVVDEAHRFIVATDVVAQASDQDRMLPWLDGVSERCGVEPQVVLADAGYCNEADLAALEQRGIAGHVARGQGASGGPCTDPPGHPSHGREVGQ